MNRRLLGVLAAAGCGAALIVAPAATATTPDCSYTVSLPATVSVKQSVVGLTATLKAVTTAGAACTAEFDASTHLVHSTDDEFFTWDNSSPTKDTESVYAISVIPGTYRTTGGTCDATSADFETSYTCTISAASTVIKFASTTRLSASRARTAPRRITLTAKSTHFTALGAKNQAATVAIQRYTNRKWRTIHTARTNAKTGAYRWTYTYAKAARYRAVSAATGAAWPSTSRTITK